MHAPMQKKLILTLYCYYREAERTLDRAIFAVWRDVQEYYHPGKRERIRGLAALVINLLPECAQIAPTARRDDVDPNISEFGYTLRLLWNLLTRNWKTTWRFSEQEIQFFAARLQALLQLLQSPERPLIDDIIALRMDMCACQWLIHRRCDGLPELAKAEKIDHFQFPYHLVPVHMQDLLGDSEPKTYHAPVR